MSAYGAERTFEARAMMSVDVAEPETLDIADGFSENAEPEVMRRVAHSPLLQVCDLRVVAPPLIGKRRDGF